MMRKDPFYLSDGSLTAYSLACGYVQRLEEEEFYKELWCEHGSYHVRSGKIGEPWQRWDTFDNDDLTKARKLYNFIKLT